MNLKDWGAVHTTLSPLHSFLPPPPPPQTTLHIMNMANTHGPVGIQSHINQKRIQTWSKDREGYRETKL